tara:strand:- start:16712 stop:17716 length:1005 start_codon:yes stop_codon:yes gene_type:complete
MVKKTTYSDLLERDPLMRNKLRYLKNYLQKKDLIELRMNRPEEVILSFANGDKKFITDSHLGFTYLETMAISLANLSGQRFSGNKPILSCKIPGGHRLQIVAYDTVSSQFAMVIRINRGQTFPMKDYGLNKSDQETVANCIKDGKTILISGATGSGKTTFLNSVIPLIPENQRIITIEGVSELQIPHKDWCALTYSENESSISGSGAKDVFRASLRLSPDRLLLGEIHPDNALTFALAINTGHEGAIATIHANNPKAAIVALIAKMIINKDTDQGSISILQKQLCTDIYGVVQISKDPKTGKRIGYFKRLSKFSDDPSFAIDVMQHVSHGGDDE